MTAPTLEDVLVEVGLDRLRADVDLTVHDGKVPDGEEPPYVLVYSQVEWPDGNPDNTVEGVTQAVTVRWICHSVGTNATAARRVAGHVRAQLLDHTPTVAGVNCGPIGQAESNPPTRDESTNQLYMDAIVTYEMAARI